MKIEIKHRFTDVIIYEHDCENNSIVKTIRQAATEDADLIDANLIGANLAPIKNDMFLLLINAITEIGNLKSAIIEGRVEGSSYHEECACLCGTLEKSDIPAVRGRIKDLRDSSRPIERFFLCIKKGSTPENNQFSKLALTWAEEFETLLNL